MSDHIPQQGEFAHPLQSVLDSMGSDPSFDRERRRIQEYISKSSVVMSGTDLTRPEHQAVLADEIRKQARAEVSQIQMAAPLSERDKEWLQVTTELLRVLTGPGNVDKHLPGEQGAFVSALLKGAFARLAPEELINDLVRVREAEAAAEQKAIQA
jgi:hypothetical protein